MYNKWLYFFHSPINELKIKGKKNKQIVQKEWLDDGSMKIIGTQPDNWHVILKPKVYTDLHKYKYQLDLKLQNIKSLLINGVKENDSFLLDEAKKLHKEYDEQVKYIQIFDKTEDLKKMDIKIFDLKSKLYNEKKFDKFNIIQTELKKAMLDKKSAYLYYINTVIPVEDEKLITKGPFPEPIVVDKISTIINKKINIKMDNNNDEDINEINSINIQNIVKKKKKANIKVVKLK